MLDESHPDGARITLEVVSRPRFLRRPQIAYAITCGIYGWLVHTRFFATEAEAVTEFERMKPGLSATLELLTLRAGVDVEQQLPEVTEQLCGFLSTFP
jgi:hypothetical protein